MAYNICEHLVSYILTENPFSEQIRKAGAWKKLFVDFFDNFISHGKRYTLKISECLLTVVPVSFFFKAAVTTVVNEVHNSIPRYSSPLQEQAVDCAAKTYAEVQASSSVAMLLKS